MDEQSLPNRDERMNMAPVRGVVPATQAVGHDQEDTQLIRAMADDAARYSDGFTWCESVLEVYFAAGVGGVLCVFLLHIRPSRDGVDEWMWVVIGDIPPAYLPLEDCSSAKEVFETYLWGMRNWVRSAKLGRSGTDEDNIPPVNVAATPENAALLEKRLAKLEELLMPFF
jgi:hypothetical protein